MISQTSRAIIGGLALFAVGGTAMPALAQDGDEARLRKVEAEVRALQRKVFPGGDGRYFEPQISAPSGTTTVGPAGSTTAVTDILARLDAMEGQLQGLTAQIEQNSNAIRVIEAQLANLGTGGSIVVPASSSSTTTSTTSTTRPSLPSSTVVTTSAATPAVTGPSAQRLAAVQAIAKPQTDDAGDDEYSYGFRLWEAGFFPEAQQQLSLFVEKYPRHPRLTYGRNLLGRAYLDGNKPGDAAPWFLKNYQDNKQAARAPDSLLYLADAMIAMKDTDRACIALAEFSETYPALAAGRLSDQYEANRKKVRCN